MRDCITKHRSSEDDTICRILRSFRRIGVVGFSDKPSRPSHRIARYLADHGYEVVPVNPALTQGLGSRAYPDLSSIPGGIEVVNIFRRAEHIPAIVAEAIEAGAAAVWMQIGLRNEASADRARRSGLLVVMDRCIMVEHGRHLSEGEAWHSYS
jgi:predicted CoA-binding protein